MSAQRSKVLLASLEELHLTETRTRILHTASLVTYQPPNNKVNQMGNSDPWGQILQGLVSTKPSIAKLEMWEWLHMNSAQFGRLLHKVTTALHLLTVLRLPIDEWILFHDTVVHRDPVQDRPAPSKPCLAKALNTMKNLEDLTLLALSRNRYGILPSDILLSNLSLPRLKRLHLDHMSASARDLISFFSRSPRLANVTLSRISLAYYLESPESWEMVADFMKKSLTLKTVYLERIYGCFSADFRMPVLTMGYSDPVSVNAFFFGNGPNPFGAERLEANKYFVRITKR